MIGKDLVKYHNYFHGPVHYTSSLTGVNTDPLSSYGVSDIPGLSGSAEDPVGDSKYPFQGHMFIQGCVSATGWLSDDGSCTKLAKIPPLSGCRGVSICGDHMRDALHMSHLTLTNTIELSSYDFRNTEISFALDKSTFKTIVFDYTRPFTGVCHVQPTNIKPGCVSTIRFIFSDDAPNGAVKLTFHPGMKWLTARPTYVHKQYTGYISLESYGDTVEDVYCSYREECLQVCPEPQCFSEGLTGFDTVLGDDDTTFDSTSATGASGCEGPLEFESWVDDCGTPYEYNLFPGDERTLLFRFDDYYFEDGGTRLWDWTGEKDNLTGLAIGDWYYNNSGVNHFRFSKQVKGVPNEWTPPEPVIKVYKGDYNDRTDTPILSTIIYDSSAPLDAEDPVVKYLPLPDQFAVKFTRSGGTRYLVKITCPVTAPQTRGSFKLTCPFRYIASRYIPK